MSLAAARTDSGLDLIGLMQEARSAADALLADATIKVVACDAIPSCHLPSAYNHHHAARLVVTIRMWCVVVKAAV